MNDLRPGGDATIEAAGAAAPAALLPDEGAIPISPNCVTIFGAGIAGLTAAHELVERGFQVQVWERANNERYPRRGCEVGGMARTQWSRVHWPDQRVVDRESSFDDDVGDEQERAVYGRQTQKIVCIDQKFYLRLDAAAKPSVFAALGRKGLYVEKGIGDIVREVNNILLKNPGIRHVYAEVAYRDPMAQPRKWDDLAAHANLVIDQLRGYLEETTLADAKVSPELARVLVDVVVVPLLRPVRFEIVVVEAFPSSDVPKQTDVIVGFRIRERWLPGEHGYRFFPSFYRHVFDSMQRTPILEPVDKTPYAQAQERAVGIRSPERYRYTETGRTAYDSVRPLASQVLAFQTGPKPLVFSRFPVRSLEEMRQYTRVFFSPESEGGFGIDPRDALRLTLRLVQYLTSCEGRRREYEAVSWWDFVQGGRLGPAAQLMLEKWPRALISMDSRAIDARSQFIGIAQLVLDQFRTTGLRDGTLKGPTNEAWLNPWRAYLEAQGVEFIHGELEGFSVVKMETPDGKVEPRVWPTVRSWEPRYALKREDEEPAVDLAAPPEPVPQPDLMPGYFVLAVSTLEARCIAKKYCEAVYGVEENWPTGSDLAKMARWAPEKSDEVIGEPPEKSPDFRHFVGIQYYFAEDVFWVDGHVYYPNSPWSLTSVSQTRFWADRTDWEHGYRGILSVIIGNWTAEGIEVTQPAAECTEEELAREVWAQINDSIRRDFASRAPDEASGAPARRTVGKTLPQPIYWHLDYNLRRDESTGKLKNKSPFPVTAPGSWDRRPGSVDGEYQIEHGIVLAGAHLKTFTRLPTMEAANESGRRAVNAILNHERVSPEERALSVYRRTLCDLWNPEDREIDDFQFFKDVDKELYSRGVAHPFEVFGVDELVRTLLTGGREDPLDPVVVWSRIRRVLRYGSPW
jgi:uncharacterized protein with NAD-binding domain and iron-sulfur cluster